MKCWEVAPEKHYYAEGDVLHIPYEKPFETAQWDPLVVLHTSGSSGFPKPIICKHGMLAVADASRNLPEKYGSRPWVPGMVDRMKRILLPSECLGSSSRRSGTRPVQLTFSQSTLR